ITGTNTFQKAGAITNLTLTGAVLHGTNKVAGTLTFQSGNMVDQLTVLPGGQLNLSGSGSIYNLTLLNQGTVNWSGGTYTVGETPPTVFSTGGLWQTTAENNSLTGGGAPLPIWTNSGTIKKTAGTGSSSFDSFQFYNQASGVVEVDSGTIILPGGTTNNSGT